MKMIKWLGIYFILIGVVKLIYASVVSRRGDENA